MNDLEERVAKLREQGGDYGLEAEVCERPGLYGWVQREPTGDQRFTCGCGYGSEWEPYEEAKKTALAHLQAEHPEWVNASAWIE